MKWVALGVVVIAALAVEVARRKQVRVRIG